MSTVLLVALSLLSRVVFAVLLVAASSLLPLFDASPRLSPDVLPLPFLRWDAFHFLHVARDGYFYERDWAFFPALPFLLRIASPRLIAVPLAVLACDSTITLYHLSLHHLRDHNLALLAALLSLLPSSPATLYFAPYTEPFFTYLSYKGARLSYFSTARAPHRVPPGMLCCARAQWFRAALFFAFAASFRSNGIFLAGFILWGMLVQPFLASSHISFKALRDSALLTALVLVPFVYHNLSAYLAFCTSDPQPWCANMPPSIYAHVQSKYWDSGLFRYWSLQQLPNFLIAAPPLLSLSAFAIHHLYYSFHQLSSPAHFLSPSITPHAIHALLMVALLLFASHTQIILRLAASMPLTYWAAAWLLVQHPKWGRRWVAWSVVWGAVSVVLWASFLPPA